MIGKRSNRINKKNMGVCVSWGEGFGGKGKVERRGEREWLRLWGFR